VFFTIYLEKFYVLDITYRSSQEQSQNKYRLQRGCQPLHILGKIFAMCAT